MGLIFSLGRPDVLPVDDFGIRTGFGIVYKKRKLPEPKQILKYGERWKPYRSIVSRYLWRAVDLASLILRSLEAVRRRNHAGRCEVTHAPVWASKVRPPVKRP